MSVTIQQIYNDVCYALLEDAGLSAGIVTQQEFLDYFREILLDWFQQVNLAQNVCVQTLLSGISEYSVPDDIINPQNAFWGARALNKTSLQELDQYEFAWKKKQGAIDRWRDDSLAPKQVSVFPTPNMNGTPYPPGTATEPIYKYGQFYPADRNLALVGTFGTLKTSFALGDTIPNVADSFTFYLGYGVLAKIFSTDGEAKDMQRAAYCAARFQEGISLARAMVGQ